MPETTHKEKLLEKLTASVNELCIVVERLATQVERLDRTVFTGNSHKPLLVRTAELEQRVDAAAETSKEIRNRHLKVNLALLAGVVALVGAGLNLVF